MKLLRCHNMNPPSVKWYVSDGQLLETALFYGTRKQCEDFIRGQQALDIWRQPEAITARLVAYSQEPEKE